MKRSFYSQFSSQRLDLRDYLALERTILSNERTLLSYGQNSLAIIATGITALYAIESLYGRVGGIALVIVGCTIGAVGILRFRRVKARLDYASPAETADDAADALSEAQLNTEDMAKR